VTADAHSQGVLSLFLDPENMGNSWNYVVICYNLGDVDKYKFMCRDNGSYGIP